jgi:hypothetical protein
MLGVLEDIEQMPLRHPSPDRFLECVATVRKRLGRLPNQMRRSVRVDRQRAVVRETPVYFLGRSNKRNSALR